MSVNPTLGERQLDAMIGEFWPVQPEPGSVADQLLKQGEARGEARGLASGVRALQSILGVPHASAAELSAKSIEELQTELDSLKRQVESRKS